MASPLSSSTGSLCRHTGGKRIRHIIHHRRHTVAHHETHHKPQAHLHPYYLIEERLLRRNLSLIRKISEAAGVEFILAFKAYALWRTFPIFREYISHTTASSPWEARLALEEFGSRAHTYSPAYEDETFGDILRCSSHISFNSLTQYTHFAGSVEEWNKAHGDDGSKVSCGLRINPEASPIETEIYNPCAPGSRFGVLAADLPETLPQGIEGLHCHCHCESSCDGLRHSLQRIEERFGHWLQQVRWINLGGGHLVTRKDYDTEGLITLLRDFRRRHPHLKVILEPGSAFGWQTGPLVSQVVDIVSNHGIRTAVLNVSFTCHMPDCLEMPYWPAVRLADGEETGAMERPEELAVPAETLENDIHATGECTYRLGGNSCLSGDWMGSWRFPRPLKAGDIIVFDDMNHYTTVKTCTFNGIAHPAIVLKHLDGTRQTLRHFTYEDYRDRMD